MTNGIVLSLLSVVAQQERITLSERTKSGLQHQACWEDARAEGRGSGLGGVSGSASSLMVRRLLPSGSAIGPIIVENPV